MFTLKEIFPLLAILPKCFSYFYHFLMWGTIKLACIPFSFIGNEIALFSFFFQHVSTEYPDFSSFCSHVGCWFIFSFVLHMKYL